MDSNLWQLIVVILILVGIIVWICRKIFCKKGYRNLDNCCGCGLADTCTRKKKSKKMRDDKKY